MNQLIPQIPRRSRDDSYRTLLDRVDFYRLEASSRLNPDSRIEFGQFLTPPAVARLMASMFSQNREAYDILDPGAGVGSLTAGLVASLCSKPRGPREVNVTAIEVDPNLASYLEDNIRMCSEESRRVGIRFTGTVIRDDFVRLGVAMAKAGRFSKRFNCAILNPPYRKIAADSEARQLLREINAEASNLYTAFLSIVVQLLEPGGELVAITPRSFCNGPYFRAFRRLFFESMTVRRVHLFESRTSAFEDDEVLQENIIFSAVKSLDRQVPVHITSSVSPCDEDLSLREITHDQLVRPDDRDQFIHIVLDDAGGHVAEQMASITHTLSEIGLTVSTGRVVDFRARQHLRAMPTKGTWPLIYPNHFDAGFVKWPNIRGKKPNSLARSVETDALLVPEGTYVLTKRFSAKEEVRRVVAAVYDPGRIAAERIGFENHLNYFHRDGEGISINLAKGLAAYLNSTLVDLYFRQFNGHTQVNATDLRKLRYPSTAELLAIGSQIGEVFPSQDEVDALVEKELTHMAKKATLPVRKIKTRIAEATTILRLLGLPAEQQNERSALTLLALLDLRLDTPWSDASSPMIGITPMMEFFLQQYGKRYAPNTRETVRRFSVHQFLQAGIILANPDDPSRAVNSPANVYQISQDALDVIRKFGTSEWDEALAEYLDAHVQLREHYAMFRDLNQIPVTLPDGSKITLSQGGQSLLLAEIIEKFCPRFTPGAQVLYVGDTSDKFVCFDETKLKVLGVAIDRHGKMPDVVVYYEKKNWLVLIEAVTSHGPVNAKRHHELQTLFNGSKAGLVFVTAFLDRKVMSKYIQEISWETEVWVADAPDHLIHFNGERFLGPYERR